MSGSHTMNTDVKGHFLINHQCKRGPHPLITNVKRSYNDHIGHFFIYHQCKVSFLRRGSLAPDSYFKGSSIKNVERLFYRNLFLMTLLCILCSCCRYTSCKAFQNTLNEMSDYAGQHEVISENMSSQIMTELIRFVQELKQERKSVIVFVLMFCLSCCFVCCWILLLSMLSLTLIKQLNPVGPLQALFNEPVLCPFSQLVLDSCCVWGARSEPVRGTLEFRWKVKPWNRLCIEGSHSTFLEASVSHLGIAVVVAALWEKQLSSMKIHAGYS